MERCTIPMPRSVSEVVVRDAPLQRTERNRAASAHAAAIISERVNPARFVTPFVSRLGAKYIS
jgi:hypothetical protein